MTLGDGSNGIVDTIWDDEQIMMPNRSVDGNRTRDTEGKSRSTVNLVIYHADQSSDRVCYSGLMVLMFEIILCHG